MPIAVFRTDGSSIIGAGHIARCLTIAELLVSKGWNAEFACNSASKSVINNIARKADYKINVLSNEMLDQPEELKSIYRKIELLVIDSYEIDDKFERKCRSFSKSIIAIDDLANRSHDVDILIDQTYGRKSNDYVKLVSSDCKLLTGSNYALLRSEFNLYRNKSINKKLAYVNEPSNILITMGSSDPDNITLKVLEIITALNLDINIKVVLGKLAPYLENVRNFIERSSKIKLLVDVTDMASLMSEADFAIGAGGVTSLERCCLGLPALTIVTASNQALLAKNLFENSCHNVIDFEDRYNSSKIEIEFLKLYKGTKLRHEMIKQCSKICDGRGVLRLLESMRDLGI